MTISRSWALELIMFECWEQSISFQKCYPRNRQTRCSSLCHQLLEAKCADLLKSVIWPRSASALSRHSKTSSPGKLLLVSFGKSAWKTCWAENQCRLILTLFAARLLDGQCWRQELRAQLGRSCAVRASNTAQPAS